VAREHPTAGDPDAGDLVDFVVHAGWWSLSDHEEILINFLEIQRQMAV